MKEKKNSSYSNQGPPNPESNGQPLLYHCTSHLLLLFHHKGAVDGEGEAGDDVEHVQDEDEGHGAVDLALAVQAEALVGIACKNERKQSSGLDNTEVAFLLLTQRPQVRIPALPRFFSDA